MKQIIQKFTLSDHKSNGDDNCSEGSIIAENSPENGSPMEVDFSSPGKSFYN